MKKKLAVFLSLVVWLGLLGLVIYHTMERFPNGPQLQLTKPSEETIDEKEGEPQEVVIVEKSKEEKQAVMKADLETMDSYGLYYDYSNMSLVEVVQSYLDEFGIDHSQVAFSYKNPETGELIGFNDTQLMTAGSTYKLPLNMLIVDGVESGEFSMEERYDIADLDFEYIGEYQAYRGQFGDDMSISEMQEYSLRYSENTPAYAMAKMLGGFEKAFSQFERYGQSRSDEVKTINHKGNQTTTDYYIQVLEHLYNNQEKYQDILYYLGISFEGQWAEAYLPHLDIYQKPGYYGEALNVEAIVMEETPYLISIYTAYLGDAHPDNDEISYEGTLQVGQLMYVINQWHRVNRN